MRSASQIMLAWAPWAISLPRRMPRSRRITMTCFGADRSVDPIVASGSSRSDLEREDTPGYRRARPSEHGVPCGWRHPPSYWGDEGRREGPMQGLGITLVVLIVAAGQEAPPEAEPAPQDVREAIGR